MSVPERGVRERVETFWQEQERQAHGTRREREYTFVFPYSYLAQKIVAGFINPEERYERYR